MDAQLEPPDPAAEAFEGLAAEVRRVREVVEGLPAALEPVDNTDYAPTLGVIAKSLAAIEQHPALRLTPQGFADQVRQAGAAAQEQGRRELAGVAQRVDAAARAMEGLLAGERTGREQNRWLAIMTGSGVVVGIVLWVAFSGLIARALPAKWNVPEQMAAATLRLDPWNAGERLLQSADPAAWNELAAGASLEHENRARLAACQAASVRAGKPKSCQIILSASAVTK